MNEILQNIENNPKYKDHNKNRPTIVRFENSLYFYGSIYLCQLDFNHNIINCFLWCIKHKINIIYLFINSTGGDLYTKERCLHYLQQAKKKYNSKNIYLECIITKYCCSAAVELALECNTVKIFKKGQIGIHYPINIKYNNDNTTIEKICTDINIRSKYENYYVTKLKLEENVLKKLLVESKLLNADDALEYNFVSEIIERMIPQYKELSTLVKEKHLLQKS